jgi:hypothetical protein
VPDHGACGRLIGVAEPVEELIAEAVLSAGNRGAKTQRM